MPSVPEQDGFVIWIDRTRAPSSRLSGSVECVRSAERARFEDPDQLLELIQAWTSAGDPRAILSRDSRSE